MKAMLTKQDSIFCNWTSNVWTLTKFILFNCIFTAFTLLILYRYRYAYTIQINDYHSVTRIEWVNAVIIFLKRKKHSRWKWEKSNIINQEKGWMKGAKIYLACEDVLTLI